MVEQKQDELVPVQTTMVMADFLTKSLRTQK